MIKLIELLDEDTGINWWDVNRKRVNEVITLFNNLQFNPHFSDWDKLTVQAKLDLCREFGKNHDFGDWQFEILDEIEEVLKKLEPNPNNQPSKQPREKHYVCIKDNQVYTTDSLQQGEELLHVDQLGKYQGLLDRHPNAILIVRQD